MVVQCGTIAVAVASKCITEDVAAMETAIAPKPIASGNAAEVAEKFKTVFVSVAFTVKKFTRKWQESNTSKQMLKS